MAQFLKAQVYKGKERRCFFKVPLLELIFMASFILRLIYIDMILEMIEMDRNEEEKMWGIKLYIIIFWPHLLTNIFSA